jgi:septal ring factor EnvC (AmiA/AmiB activator)
MTPPPTPPAVVRVVADPTLEALQAETRRLTKALGEARKTIAAQDAEIEALRSQLRNASDHDRPGRDRFR